MSAALDLDLELTEPQEEFVFSDAQFPAFIGGFGSGKSHSLIVRSLLGKLAYPSLDRGYFAPTWDLIRLIAWPRYEALLSDWGIGYKLHKSEKWLKLSTGGKIIFRSLDTPERIVGFEICDAEVDELDTLDVKHAEDCWNKIIGRCRQKKPDKKPATVGVATTPEGFRFVYQRWHVKASDTYRMTRSKTSDNPFLDPSYEQQLRETYSEQLVKAYVDGLFVNMTTGSVYPEFDRTLNRADLVPEKNEPLHIGMDFNVMNMTAIVHVIREDRPYAVDELVGVRDTPAMAELIHQRFRAGGQEGRSISIYPDASGDSRHSTNASVSDLAILSARHYRVCANPANPRVKDRVNAMNGMIKNDKGERRYKVNVQKCTHYTDSLEKQPYDENGEPDKKTGLDHPADAGGYFISFKYPVSKPVTSLNIGRAR